jgi:hypothetical protein
MVTDEKIAAFLTALQAKQDERMTKSYPTLDKPTYVAERGKRYVKIVTEGKCDRSVFCFIDAGNGDILKAASWKTPAKHARGNIMGETHGVEFLGPYGAQYLR